MWYSIYIPFFLQLSSKFCGHRITSYNVCYTKLLRESKNGASNGGNNAANNAANEGDVKLAKDQTLRINMSAEPPTFDPAQAQDSQANTVLKMMYEGLVRMDADDKEAPGAAESWEVDGTKYTFHLRKDAKWSNGDPVTAKDFVFAWERVLNPNTQPAPPYRNNFV